MGIFNENIAINDGWDLAYSSSQQHEVGVIDSDLLPSKTLVYKYYFELNPQMTTTGSLGIFQIGLATDYIVFDLDFVVSGPVWNQLITVTEDNVSNDILTLPLHVIDVAYIFKVTLDENGNVVEILDSVGENPVDPDTLPDKPDDNDEKDAWFEFYANFDENGDWSAYNRFQGKQGSPDQEYTLEHKTTSNQTNSKRIKVKNLNIGDNYIVSYEGVKDHLFRHHVDMTFDQIVLIQFGVNLTAGYFPYENASKSRFAHYLWKKWTDHSGGEHEGWRVSETWQMDANAHRLLNENASYDPVSNQISGTDRYLTWAKYNMTERNLAIRDSERIGYSTSYAKYLEEKAKESTLTTEEALFFNTNDIVVDSAHPSNFELGYVADNAVNYSGGGYGFVQQGGATGVGFSAINTQYYGFFMSNYYKRNFPKNTRMVSAYSRIRHGGNGRVIQVLLSKGGQYVTAIQDPMFFMTVRGKLYYHYFDDDFFKIMMAYKMSKTTDEIEFSGNKLLGTGSPTGEGTYEEPGRSMFIADNTDTAKTFNDDSNLISSPTIDPPPTSIAKYLTVVGTIDDITDTYADKPASAVRVFSISGMSSDSVIRAIKVLVNTTSKDDSFQSVFVRIKGIGDLDREICGITLPVGREYYVELGAWEDMEEIIIMSDSEFSLESCGIIELDPSIEKRFHLISDIKSMAAAATNKGNILLFYTDSYGRINVVFTSSQSFGWFKYENILMRGDQISDIKGVPNMEDDVFFIFHFYKDSLLCVPMDITFFMTPTDPNKKVEALDTFRRQSCNLVWGKLIKQDAENVAKKDADGKYVYEDISDNVISSEEDVASYQGYGRSVLSISSSNNADITTKDMSNGNKFIYIGTKTESEGLAASEPSSTDYSVFMSKRGALRLFIESEDKNGKTVIRNLNSYDNGFNWENGWKYEKVDDSSDTEHVVRINYLSDGEDSEEGTNISLLYNKYQNVVYILYFYLGAVLCKTIDEEIFNMQDLDEQADIINSTPIYAVAGNFEAIIGESNYEELKSTEGRHIFLSSFQKKPYNIDSYYSREYYSAQPISGYCTNGGYIRIFLVNDSNTIDGYFYDGGSWIPDKSVLI